MTQTTEVIYDTDNQFSWDVITRTFIDGVIQTEERVMDNGITKTSQYEDGVLFTRTEVDVNDVMDWQEIIYGYYETGELIGKFTTWDNGFVRQAYYLESGELIQVEMFDDLVTPEGVYPWTYIKREYNGDGTFFYEFIERDNGSTKELTTHGDYIFVEQHDDLVTAEGAYAWTYIETYYYLHGGKLLDNIQYDNGVHVTSSYYHSNGALSEVVKSDGETGEAGIYDWASINTRFYENGNKSSEIIIYDNDTFSVADYYETGQLKQIELNDGPYGTIGIFDWYFKMSLYDEDGNLTRKFVLFDDSDVRDEYFENGVRVRMVQEDDRDDTGLNTEIWDQIETFYNADGTRYQRVITYDDGTTKVETYEDDALVSAVRTDDQDAYDWDQIDYTYHDSGAVLGKLTTFDNGVVRDAYYYENGQLGYLEMFDDAVTPEGVRPWTYIHQDFNGEGTPSYEFIEFDNGGTKESSYWSNGNLREVIQKDYLSTPEGGSFDWAVIQTLYDQNGLKYNEFKGFDNGRVVETRYEAGQLTYRSIVDDFNGGPGQHDWDSIQTKFYDNGNKSSEFTFYDDGSLTIAEYYESGQLSIFYRQDGEPGDAGQYDWAGKYTAYNEDGSIESKVTVFDDGDARTEYFENGIRVRMVQEDDPEDTGLNTAIWDRIETLYNADGSRNERITTYDDGTTKVETFQNDVLVWAERTDDQDAFDWDQIVFAYDEVGTVTTQTRQMDDTDVIIFLYEEEEIATRLHVDNDDSHSWYLRVTDFAEAGDVITTYASYDEVPPEYQALIGVA